MQVFCCPKGAFGNDGHVPFIGLMSRTAFPILAWELQAISHHALADLSARLDELGKQTSRWQQWFAAAGRATA